MRAAAAALALAACAPPLPQGVPAVADATYRCDDGRTVAVRFDNRASAAVVHLDGRRFLLTGRRPASGIWYAGDGLDLRGRGRAATLTGPGGRATECTAG